MTKVIDIENVPFEEMGKVADAVYTRFKIVKIIEKLVNREDSNYSVGIILNRAGVEINRHTSDDVLLRQLENYYKTNFAEIDYDSD